ncbi:hypothetical protein [Microbacterium sp.]|uniref:hypothetical protein n=1 Tax=Microbacterium sp. TaxID=51671 RepID=UPI0028114133|nr:hypothetical protein [Microbacterium sp.]
MYEHPYLAYRATELDLEQLERAAEHRRFIEEHADQIIRRPEGAFRRAVRRMTGGARRAAAAPAAPRCAEGVCELALAR